MHSAKKARTSLVAAHELAIEENERRNAKMLGSDSSARNNTENHNVWITICTGLSSKLLYLQRREGDTSKRGTVCTPVVQKLRLAKDCGLFMTWKRPISLPTIPSWLRSGFVI